MIQPFREIKNVDRLGNPSGDISEAKGIYIRWQFAYVETVVAMAIFRLKYYQRLEDLKCEQNEVAILNLQKALDILKQRKVECEPNALSQEYENLSDN